MDPSSRCNIYPVTATACAAFCASAKSFGVNFITAKISTQGGVAKKRELETNMVFTGLLVHAEVLKQTYRCLSERQVGARTLCPIA